MTKVPVTKTFFFVKLETESWFNPTKALQGIGGSCFQTHAFRYYQDISVK